MKSCVQQASQTGMLYVDVVVDVTTNAAADMCCALSCVVDEASFLFDSLYQHSWVYFICYVPVPHVQIAKQQALHNSYYTISYQ